MSQHDYMTICGDRHYVERVCQKHFITLGWSRKRRKKWLRREGFKLTPQADPLIKEFSVTLDDDDVLMGPCWCGEKNPFYADIHETCGGTGMLNCICGGDLCVCHNHGYVECFGCPDCDGGDESDFDEGDDDPEFYDQQEKHL